MKDAVGSNGKTVPTIRINIIKLDASQEIKSKQIKQVLIRRNNKNDI